jgi:hypothetical protein
MGLRRDAGKGHRQPRHKGDAVRNGYRACYCSPGDGRIPVRHRAQDTSITEGTAILQSGGWGQMAGTAIAGRARNRSSAGPTRVDTLSSRNRAMALSPSDGAIQALI